MFESIRHPSVTLWWPLDCRAFCNDDDDDDDDDDSCETYARITVSPQETRSQVDYRVSLPPPLQAQN